MSRNTRRLVLASLTAATLALLVVSPAIIRAFNPQPEPPARFGMTGLAFAQTARLNVVNLQDPPDPNHPPDPGVPPNPCQVTLGFVDSSGQTFTDRAGREITAAVSLPPAQAAFLDLRSEEVFDPRSGDVLRNTRRLQFRAGLEFLPPIDPDMPDPCRNVVPTLEIFDTFTGRTTVLYQPPDPGVDPPEPGLPR